MEDYAKIFEGITGKRFSLKSADYRGREEIDENIFETVSRLFFENREAFYFLKRKIEGSVKKNRNRIFLSAAGYFYYVDCDFAKAIKCFKESINLSPREIETWFCLAFCYRQTGEDGKFDSIMMDYETIIEEFIRGRVVL